MVLKMPPEVLLKFDHHSLTDWDFQYGASYRTLASDYFVSPPTSLKITGTTDNVLDAILCKYAGTTVLPQGAVDTWFRGNTHGVGFILFRNQRAVGGADVVNCYLVNIEAVRAVLYVSVGGAWDTIGSFACVHDVNTWQRFRVTWWIGENSLGVTALCVNLYEYIGGTWVQRGVTLYDTNNRWAASAVNRCGLGAYVVGGNNLWFDDTEIWGV